MSPTLPVLVAGIGLVVGVLATLGRSNQFTVFLGVCGTFLIAAFLIWETSEIRFEDDKIIRRILFIYDRRYPISEIKKVRFNDDADSFGGKSIYVTIEFGNGRTFILRGFPQTDIQEIIQVTTHPSAAV
jgi:hypothetical protein